MPLSFPISRQISAYGQLPSGIDIEFDLVKVLSETELTASLCDEISTATAEISRKDIKSQGKTVTIDFDIVRPVHLHPLVYRSKIYGLAGPARHKAGITHDVRSCSIRRLINKFPDRFGNSRAYKIPQCTAEE